MAVSKRKEFVLFPFVQVDDVTHVIQLAVAPVFLLTAVGTIIGVLTNRLVRIVDRIRVLERKPETPVTDDEAAFKQLELGLLGRRLRMIYIALTSEVICGLIVGVMIASAFIDAFLAIKLSAVIAGLFILAMLAFICGLTAFLREIFLAVQSTRASLRVGF
ncbi:DUF2721 domain-containing protein [Janthinobacterium sp. 17J80-10]|uniref:DUF2721 domain-containing protein n=1 Tax=Janthinobacterium sp. 17J80-10 TaxID=2497863 RepID=UPI0019D6EE1B|nr:DUF2721 domain-containing protein [Janthinobacterium sp. 17J80-10]